MRKFKFFAAIGLLALASVLSPGTGYSASQLPWINPATGSVLQPICPTGIQSGCFNPGIQTGYNGPVNSALANAAPYPYTPFEPCLQFMQLFLRMAAGSR